MKNSDMPAMPIEINGFRQYAPECHTGLTKREMFAIHAMQGLCGTYFSQETIDFYDSSEQLVKCLIESSVELADALLVELERTK